MAVAATASTGLRIGCSWLGNLAAQSSLRLAPASRSPRRSSAVCRMTTASQGASGLDAAAAGRAKAAVLGSLLADAATMPLHWLYDVDKVAGLLQGEGRAGAPEFFPKPSCPFYELPCGALSPYGEEEYAVLQYAAAHPDIDGPGLMEHLVGFFGAYQGRLNSTSNKLLEGWAAGQRFPAAAPDDSQAHAIVKVPVLVARYGGTPELAARVEAAVRTQQNNDTAVAMGQAAAAILERVVVEGSSVSEAVAWALQPGSVAPEVRAELAPLVQAQEQAGGGAAPSLREMVWEVTKAPHCGLPGALINALYCAQTSSGYQDNVRRNIEVAGDNCSRILFGGALWAAAEGEGALPAAWKAQLAPGKWQELEALVDQLLSHRGA